MPRLSQDERQQAIGMLAVGAHSQDVARRYNVQISIITRVRRLYKTVGSVSNRPRSGQSGVTTPTDDRQIRLVHLRNRPRLATLTA